MTQNIREVRVVEQHAYYVNKLRQKRWFGKINMSSNCDITNNTH